MAQRFGEKEAVEFFQLYTENLDALSGQERKVAWSRMVKLLDPLMRLMLENPEVDKNPVVEGERVGILLWNHGALDIARTTAQSKYSGTFARVGELARNDGRLTHALFFEAISEQLKDPDEDEWILV
ncbi:hypothetical protein EG329_007588 [Mollisiaceae sp. DMI_Dod_QoI]|nr:hypothetical protein EG329_007588 [Helotiales sp. DMI_Dod_QoI]